MCVIFKNVMAKRRLDEVSTKDEGGIVASDAADQVFWDEFWRQENSKTDKGSLVTITIRNQETGEEKIVENVRLRFRSMRVLRD